MSTALAAIFVILYYPSLLDGGYLGNLLGVLCVLLVGALLSSSEILSDGNIGSED